jgi:glycosyltransferase involved in cell wall biosynthesis
VVGVTLHRPKFGIGIGNLGPDLNNVTMIARGYPTMTVMTCFTNFGPYHLARLRALAHRLARRGDCLLAYELAGSERTYPWKRSPRDEPFEWITLFPDRIVETIESSACRLAMVDALDYDRPDVVVVAGYARPESMAAARWARRHGRPAILMSESQAIDRPRVWWKEFIKRRRLRSFDAALVGGPEHRDYLAELGLRPRRVALGYNAVDNAYFATAAQHCRDDPQGRAGLPDSPYFLTVCRFVPDKNLTALIKAFSHYRAQNLAPPAWDLVLCGGGPAEEEVDAAIAGSGCSTAIHRPGFLQVADLPRWYAHAGAFVLPSLCEPWGLVANEAAASGLPLLVSRRAGCSTTLVPDPEGTTGARFDPEKVEEISSRLAWMASSDPALRTSMGLNAAEIVSLWGPDRFASGVVEAIALAQGARRVRTRSAAMVMRDVR